MNRNKYLFRVKIALSYLLVKLRFLQHFLPERIKDRLPLGWNGPMFWQAFKSGGKNIHVDYYCCLQPPDSYQPKVTVDEKYRLSEAEIRSFYRDGYIGPFTMLSPEEAESVKNHLVNLINNKESSVYPYTQGAFEILQAKGKAQPTSEKKVMNNHEVAFRGLNMRDRYIEDPVLLSLFKHPALTERCAQLLGPDLLLWRTQFFAKAPKGPGTPFHQESTYLFENRKESVVNPPDFEDLFQLACWFALTDAKKENSCMMVVADSNQEIHTIKMEEFDASKADSQKGRFANLSIELDYPIDSQKVKTIEMKAGQFYIFSERAIHGSTDNKTDQWRWAVAGRIVRPNTKIYTKKMLENNHSMLVGGIDNIKLDNWKAALLRGEDRFGYNRLLEESTKSKGEKVGVN